MPAPRIHTTQPLATGARLALEPGPANHLVRVLRMQTGDPVVLFNGSGGEYEAVIDEVQRARAWIRVGAFVDREAESPLTVMLGQGISKGERMDYTIQKAVELGVSAIVPLVTERTVVQLKGERAEKRRVHWQAVATGACEQCGRNRIPTVHAPRALADWLAEPRAGDTALLLDPEAGLTLPELIGAPGSFALLAGPEGGLTDQERAAAAEAGFSGIRLGPRVLRTETAAVAMLAALQTLCGDFR